jgi:hypothetical protein
VDGVVLSFAPVRIEEGPMHVTTRFSAEHRRILCCTTCRAVTSDTCETGHTARGYSASSPEHVTLRLFGWKSGWRARGGRTVDALTLPSCRVSGAGSLEVYSYDSSIGEGPTGSECGFTCTDLLAMVNL